MKLCKDCANFMEHPWPEGNPEPKAELTVLSQCRVPYPITNPITGTNTFTAFQARQDHILCGPRAKHFIRKEPQCQE